MLSSTATTARWALAQSASRRSVGLMKRALTTDAEMPLAASRLAAFSATATIFPAAQMRTSVPPSWIISQFRLGKGRMSMTRSATGPRG